MLEQTLTDIYTKFKIHFYQEVFKSINAGKTMLSTLEIFCVEIIHALKEPTINEFANFIQVSSPNATYKVNSLIKKGYIEKIQSAQDKREYHLKVTQKYFDLYNLNQNYLAEIVRRAQEHFAPNKIEELDTLLYEISNDLMWDADILSIDLNEVRHG